MTIYLIVGLPGTGKTTRAKELEISESALRLTPDDWQMAVFERDSARGGGRRSALTNVTESKASWWRSG